jgi:hypothetical protein
MPCKVIHKKSPSYWCAPEIFPSVFGMVPVINIGELAQDGFVISDNQLV